MDISERHRIRTEKNGALRQRAAGLVHADRGHIRARIHRRRWKPITEIEVRTVCLIDQYLHPAGMRFLRNGTQIRADAVIGRIVDKYRLGVRMALHRVCDIVRAHPERNPKRILDAWIDIDRHSAAENQCIDGTSMNIARHDDLVAASYRR